MKKLLIISLLLLTVPLYSAIINLVTDDPFLSEGGGPGPILPVTISNLSFDAPSSNLLDENTILFVDFTNPNSAGDEEGLSGNANDTRANLLFSETGTIPASTNSSPVTGYLDDGYYKDLDGTDDHYDAQKKYLTGDSSDWTIEMVIQKDTNPAQEFLFDTGATSNSNKCFSLFALNGNIGLLAYRGSGVNEPYFQTTATSATIGDWIHIVARKIGDDFQIVWADIDVDGHITSKADIDALPAGQKTTLTHTGASVVGELQHNVVIGARNITSTADYVNAKFAWLRISNIARYQN